ncbi:CatB-related O-acetyltransferase [Dysgonomonas capnocytophagoides]|uniref:CatB-related O-acetyltransferase n=1 Tax=Dysgonomonas capnocytophagoides TaxID=45254 RepID=UPI002A821EB4|nr:CatB-related O-acetyltransferase [Dysgonomonas capnocytophagoides]
MWRKNNSHNFTFVANSFRDTCFPLDKVNVGKNTYGNLLVYSYGSDDESLSIGSYCSIAENVKFLLGGMHNMNTLSSYPFKVKIMKTHNETFSKGSIVVEDDVWIGADCLIMSGCKLAVGTIVAAGSVVTKSTEPYSIVGGNPAKFIRKRFSDEVIRSISSIDKVKLIDEIIKSGRIDLLYQELTISLLEKLEDDYLN